MINNYLLLFNFFFIIFYYIIFEVNIRYLLFVIIFNCIEVNQCLLIKCIYNSCKLIDSFFINFVINLLFFFYMFMIIK